MADFIKQDNENIALEAIDFQIDTKFADSIRNVYQDIINFRETKRGDRHIVRDVIEYAENKIDTEFHKLWPQHLGIKLGQITLSNSPSFFFAMQPIMGSDRELAKIIDSMTGNSLYGSGINFSKKTYEEVKKIAASFDRRKGRVAVGTYLKKDLTMNFFFDPYVAFLIRDTLHVHLDYFTAEELTAITLHEVGHMMSLLEHCADMFYNVSLNASIIKSFKDTAPLSEKIKAVREIIKDKNISKTISENSKLKPQEADAATEAVKNVDNFRKEDNYNDSSWSFWNTILNFFISTYFLGCEILAWVFAPVNAAVWQLVQDILISFGRDYVQKGGYNQPKYSDYLSNKTTAFNWERWADEYVTRYGYGSHLNTGLNKLFDSMAKTQLFTGMNDKGVDTWLRNSSVALALNYVLHYTWSILLGGNMDDGFGIYESQVDRMKRVIQDTANVFKRMDLPQEVVDLYIIEFEKCKKSLDEVSMARRGEHVFALFHRCVMSFIDPVQLGNRLLRGNIKAEYAQLANDIDELRSNQLYYNAAKINSILNKRG